LVSILLLTYNGRDTVQAVLSAVASQKASFPFELVAVDSGSRDATVASPLGQYLGAKSTDSGGELLRARGI
jgi:hypothetical protein